MPLREVQSFDQKDRPGTVRNPKDLENLEVVKGKGGKGQQPNVGRNWDGGRSTCVDAWSMLVRGSIDYSSSRLQEMGESFFPPSLSVFHPFPSSISPLPLLLPLSLFPPWGPLLRVSRALPAHPDEKHRHEDALPLHHRPYVRHFLPNGPRFGDLGTDARQRENEGMEEGGREGRKEGGEKE